MRAFLGCILTVCLAAVPAMAVPGGAGDSSPVPARSANPAAAKATPGATSGAKAPAKSDVSSIEYEIDELRDALDQQSRQIQSQSDQLKQQQKTIQALEEQLKAAGTTSENAKSTPAAPAPDSTPAAATVAANEPAAAPSVEAAHSTSRLARLVADLKGGTEAGGTMAAAGSSQAPEQKLSDLAYGKVKIGATFYGFYAVFPRTGFGPQTLDNTDIYPGPGNNGYNEFNINRTYINLFYSPIDALTFRVTPNIYREVGGASGEKLSSTSAAGSSVNGNLSFRLKYAYMDINTLFHNSKAFGKDKLTFGQQQQPLTDWEEGLYGFRFVNLTPWNYLSLSSTFVGVKLHGPIEYNGKQYLDYEIGVFNNSSFHAYEVGDKKQVMARLSYYPFGASSKYEGLGLTGFVDYGYKDAAPDQNVNVPDTRVAALVHYQAASNDYGIAGEFDYGRNAFSEGNLFSGSGPSDYFGLGPTPYAGFSDLAGALLKANTRQLGFDFFGHARIAKSPFYLFGMFEQFEPNTNVSIDPLDFRTVIGGISYKYGKYWQFAVDSKNIQYYHSQFTFPASQLALFSPSVGALYPNGIPNAVPTDTNEVSFNILFNY
jgi:TolA-binding protein